MLKTSSCQHLRKYKENSMENVHADARVQRATLSKGPEVGKASQVSKALRVEKGD